MASESLNLLLSLFALGDSTGNGHSDWGSSANANFETLEAAISNQITKTVNAADVTLSESEGFNLFLKTDGVLTGNRSVILPARKHLFLAQNTCTGAFTLTFKVAAQTGVTLSQGRYALLYCDGTTTVDLFSELNTRIDLAYIKANILGTVSQTAGVPTGPIIEHSEGVGANYVDLIRFADGTQIVRGKSTLLRSTTTIMQSTVTFPKNFVDADYSVSVSFRPIDNADAAVTYTASCTLGHRDLLAPIHGTRLVSSVVINAYGIAGAGTFGAADELYVDYTITGRWF